MDKDKHTAALAAMTDLVRSVLDGDEASRFQKASSLCALAQKVALHGAAPRVGELKQAGIGIHGIHRYIGGDGAMYDGIGAGMGDAPEDYGMVYPNPHTAPNDLQRQLLMALTPMLATHQRSQASSELSSLITARDLLKLADGSEEQVTKLTERINTLVDVVTASVTKENENANVVPTELLRRHQAGIDGQAGDEGDGVRPIPPGEARDDGAAAGSGEAAGGGTLLEPQRFPPFRSRLDQGTDAGAEGADLQSAEALAESAQAGPGTGERGEVRGREDAGDDGARAERDRPGYERYRGLDHTGKAIFDP